MLVGHNFECTGCSRNLICTILALLNWITLYVIVDFHKVLETIELDSIMQALEATGIGYRYSNFIQNIYNNAPMTVKLFENTKHTKVNRRVRQGDILSPKLFTVVLEHALKTGN